MESEKRSLDQFEAAALQQAGMFDDGVNFKTLDNLADMYSYVDGNFKEELLAVAGDEPEECVYVDLGCGPGGVGIEHTTRFVKMWKKAEEGDPNRIIGRGIDRNINPNLVPDRVWDQFSHFNPNLSVAQIRKILQGESTEIEDEKHDFGNDLQQLMSRLQSGKLDPDKWSTDVVNLLARAKGFPYRMTDSGGFEAVSAEKGAAAIFERTRDRFAELIVGDATDVPLESKSVNFLYSVTLLQYVADKLKVLEEVYRILRDGSKAVFLAQNSIDFGLTPDMKSMDLNTILSKTFQGISSQNWPIRYLPMTNKDAAKQLMQLSLNRGAYQVLQQAPAEQWGCLVITRKVGGPEEITFPYKFMGNVTREELYRHDHGVNEGSRRYQKQLQRSPFAKFLHYGIYSSIFGRTVQVEEQITQESQEVKSLREPKSFRSKTHEKKLRRIRERKKRK